MLATEAPFKQLDLPISRNTFIVFLKHSPNKINLILALFTFRFWMVIFVDLPASGL